jgi:hypothetical protein
VTRLGRPRHASVAYAASLTMSSSRSGRRAASRSTISLASSGFPGRSGSSLSCLASCLRRLGRKIHACSWHHDATANSDRAAVARAAVIPERREPAADQHPRDRPQPGRGDLANDHRPERLKRRAGEARREQEQKLLQRRWDAEHRRQPPWAAANGPPIRPRKWREQPTLRGTRRCSFTPPLSVRSATPSAHPARPAPPRRPPRRTLKSAKAEGVLVVSTERAGLGRAGRDRALRLGGRSAG